MDNEQQVRGISKYEILHVSGIGKVILKRTIVFAQKDI
jgi:hypothetical protein